MEIEFTGEISNPDDFLEGWNYLQEQLSQDEEYAQALYRQNFPEEW